MRVTPKTCPDPTDTAPRGRLARHLPRLLIACSALLLLGQAPPPAGLVPDAPITAFRLPVFGENGFKQWEIRGRAGHYLGPESARVEGLDVRVYREDAPGVEAQRLTSDEARIELQPLRASSATPVFLKGDGYSVAGEAWSWDADAQRLEIEHEVRALFTGELDLLR